jgi:hypothetical protein
VEYNFLKAWRRFITSSGKEKELWLLDYRLTNYFRVSLTHTWMTATSLSAGNDWLIGNPWWEIAAVCSKFCYLGYYDRVVSLSKCVKGKQNSPVAITCNTKHRKNFNAVLRRQDTQQVTDLLSRIFMNVVTVEGPRAALKMVTKREFRARTKIELRSSGQ